MNALKSLSLIGLCLLFSLNAKAMIIISDIDDTLKISDTISPKTSIKNILKGVEEPYPLMLSIFQDFKTKNATFIYLSNSYVEIYNAEHWLQQRNFPSGEVLQRENIQNRLLSPKVHQDHKKTRLDEIFNKYDLKNEKILLFGDNVSDDEDIYVNFCQKYSLDCAIFIRDIKGEQITISPFRSKKLNPKVHLYLTEYDLFFEHETILNKLVNPLIVNSIIATGPISLRLSTITYFKKYYRTQMCGASRSLLCRYSVDHKITIALRHVQKMPQKQKALLQKYVR